MQIYFWLLMRFIICIQLITNDGWFDWQFDGGLMDRSTAVSTVVWTVVCETRTEQPTETFFWRSCAENHIDNWSTHFKWDICSLIWFLLLMQMICWWSQTIVPWQEEDKLVERSLSFIWWPEFSESTTCTVLHLEYHPICWFAFFSFSTPDYQCWWSINSSLNCWSTMWCWYNASNW